LSHQADVLSAWAVFSVVPFVIGELIARRSVMTVELTDNLRQLRVEQEHRIRGAVTDELNRVARELHDVIAHCVSVMVIQAARSFGQLDPQRRTSSSRSCRRGRQRTD
jgi:nitrate/nitrite-specific signal transduction histidine kinase